ncbi:unnamed protein product [Ciceribacter sp. T2.26MG-112.2]|nr:unnamed protein product [Ciceribacter naphthalenivorans]
MGVHIVRSVCFKGAPSRRWLPRKLRASLRAARGCNFNEFNSCLHP